MHVSSWRYLQERYAHWSIATHNDCAMSFRDGLEAIRSGNDDGSFTVIARHMAAEPERVSSAAFLLASSAWYVRAEDASAHDFFADVSKELCDLTEEEMGREKGGITATNPHGCV